MLANGELRIASLHIALVAIAVHSREILPRRLIYGLRGTTYAMFCSMALHQETLDGP